MASKYGSETCASFASVAASALSEFEHLQRPSIRFDKLEVGNALAGLDGAFLVQINAPGLGLVDMHNS